MIAPVRPRQDHGAWAGHAVVALFFALVAAVLAAVPGWSDPLLAWVAVANLALALLVLHSAGGLLLAIVRRRWHRAAVAALVCAGLVATACGLSVLTLRSLNAPGEDQQDFWGPR